MEPQMDWFYEYFEPSIIPKLAVLQTVDYYFEAFYFISKALLLLLLLLFFFFYY
jgi:hypothetical protein